LFPLSSFRTTSRWHISRRAISALAGRDTLVGMETPGSAPSPQAAPDTTAPITPGASREASGPVWRFLVEPRWLGWHAFTVLAIWGMLWLGDWQFHRAIAGNGLSWAYTFEWPLFAGFGVIFWVRTVRDEFRLRRGVTPAAGQASAPPVLPEGIGTRQIDRPGDDADDADLASYNAYLTKLHTEVKGHGKRRAFW
jgi:hypothetical protein